MEIFKGENKRRKFKYASKEKIGVAKSEKNECVDCVKLKQKPRHAELCLNGEVRR